MKRNISIRQEFFRRSVAIDRESSTFIVTNFLCRSQQRQEQLALLHKKQMDEPAYREKAIKDHEAAIKRHQAAIEAARK